MWVPRTPKRADFCGCPPCPLCFCWAGGERITDGIDQMALDMLGRPATDGERAILQDSAEKIHAGNLARPEKIEREFRQADEERGDTMQMEHFLKEQRAQSARPPAPKLDLRPTLDELPAEAFEEKKPVTFTGWITFDEAVRNSLGNQVFTWGVDVAAEEKEQKKPTSKWDGGDVKKKADKLARRQREAMLAKR